MSLRQFEARGPCRGKKNDKLHSTSIEDLLVRYARKYATRPHASSPSTPFLWKPKYQTFPLVNVAFGMWHQAREKRKHTVFRALGCPVQHCEQDDDFEEASLSRCFVFTKILLFQKNSILLWKLEFEIIPRQFWILLKFVWISTYFDTFAKNRICQNSNQTISKITERECNMQDIRTCSTPSSSTNKHPKTRTRSHCSTPSSSTYKHPKAHC